MGEIKDVVFSLVETFGLRIDYDQWDTKGWIRVEDVVYKEMKPLIIYKEDVDNIGIQLVKDELIQYLMSIGEHGFKIKLNELIKI